MKKENLAEARVMSGDWNECFRQYQILSSPDLEITFKRRKEMYGHQFSSHELHNTVIIEFIEAFKKYLEQKMLGIENAMLDL